MLSQAERIMAIREGGWTERMHTKPKLRRQTVAEHSWGVAVLAAEMFPDAFSGEMLLACLYHDVPERWVGDSPHPAKKLFTPSLGKALHDTEQIFVDLLGLDQDLTTREALILGFCDAFEYLLWVREEIALGNSLMRPHAEACIEMLQKNPLFQEKLELILGMLSTGFSETTDWWKELINAPD